MSWLSLALTFSLVGAALVLSYKEKIGLEKDMIIGSVRAVVQLLVIGYMLETIFQINHVWLTTVLLLIMVYNASSVAAKRGEGIRHAQRIAFGSILMGLLVTMGGLISFQVLSYQPKEVIPVSGMVVGNSMVALGLLYRQMVAGFRDKRTEVEIKLCLGATPKEAAQGLIRLSMKTAMLPTIDSMKTLGIVQLPGMMTGLILAGTSPAAAIQYQIMVAFMLTGAVTVTAFVASYWAYRAFFNEQAQLVR